MANHKGGVGKTTTAIHLAHGLSLSGRRVILLDLDPQGNASVALQDMPAPPVPPAHHPLLQPIAESFWLVSGSALHNTELDELIAGLKEAAEWLIVDCPPRLDGLGWAGVLASDEVIVPVQTEFLAMHGLSQMLASLESVAGQTGGARLRGVLPTMVDSREPIALEVLEDLRKNLGSRLLGTPVYRDANLVEAASFGRSAFQHCPWSKGALCYAELTKELLDG
ncbi:MAG: ParA family protein [Planctomycetes bacterium]|nr:ParA family protein [Planctomycetota bacterium]